MLQQEQVKSLLYAGSGARVWDPFSVRYHSQRTASGATFSAMMKDGPLSTFAMGFPLGEDLCVSTPFFCAWHTIIAR